MKLHFVKKLSTYADPGTAPGYWRDYINRSMEMLRGKRMAFLDMMKAIVEKIDYMVIRSLHHARMISVPLWDAASEHDNVHESTPERPLSMDSDYDLHDGIDADEAESLLEYARYLEIGKKSLEKDMMEIHALLNSAKEELRKRLDDPDDVLWSGFLKDHLQARPNDAQDSIGPEQALP